MRVSAMLVSTAAVVGGLLSAAHATVVYSDNFDGTAGALAGRSPTATGLAGGTSGATWASDAAPAAAGNPDAVFTTTGGTSTGTNSTYASIGTFTTGADTNQITDAYLPFAPVAGNVYDFHLDVAPSGAGASGNWLALAFATAGLNGHGVGNSSALSNDSTYGLILLTGKGGVQAFGGNPATNSPTANQIVNSTTGVNVSATAPVFNGVDLYLDTTGSAYKVTWALNGNTLGSYTYTTNPNIGDLIFGTNKLTGAVGNFSLTATPEPGSIALLGLGGLTALRRRRA